MNEEEVLLKIKSMLDASGLNQAKDKMSEVEDRAGGMGNKFGGIMSGMGGAAVAAGKVIAVGLAVGTAAVLGLAAMSVGAASDIAESQNKANVVFGESVAQINELAATSAVALGQTKGEVLAAAGTFGNLLTASGNTREVAADMSVQFVKLASDLGSFNNANPSDVLDAIKSGMLGSAEPLQKFGVTLNDVTMANQAVMDGLISGVGDWGTYKMGISEAEKQQIRYNIIMRQTETAQGDFANTSEGAANGMKIVKAQIDDSVAAIGAGLLPAWEAAVGVVSRFLQSAKFDDVKQSVIDFASTVGDKMKAIIGDFDAVFGGALSGAPDSLALVGSAAGIMSDDVTIAASDASGLRDKFIELKDAAIEIADRIGEAAEMIQYADEWSSSLGETLARVGEVILGLDQGALTPMGEAWDTVSGIISTTAGFLTGTVIPAVLALTGFLVEHRDIVLGVAVAFGVFKLAMAIKSAHGALVKALVDINAKFGIVTVSSRGASLSLRGVGVAMKAALGPLGLLMIAVGLLTAAWAGNWGDIRGKTAAVVEWFQGVPAMLASAWADLKSGVAGLKDDWIAKWDEVKGSVADIDWPGLGLDIVMGIVGGLTGAHGLLISAVADLATAAWDKMTGFWETASRSKRTVRLGRWIMEGLGFGIGAGGVTARQAMDDAMAGLNAALSDNAIDAWRTRFEAFGAEVRSIMLSFGMADGQNAEIGGLIDEGRFDRAMQLWTRYYDELKTAEQDRHDFEIAKIEERNALNDEGLEKAKRRIEALKAMVGDGGEISGFSLEVDKIEADMGDLLSSIGFAGSKALDDFFSMWTGGAVKAIMNSEQLMQAIDALATYQADANAAQIEAENERHELVMANWGQSEEAMRLALEEQAYAEERINEILAYRAEKLKELQDAIRAQQAAEEAFQERVNEQVMAHLDAYERAREDAHDAALAALVAERDAHLARFEAAEVAIDHLKVELAEMRVDLGIEAETAKLGEMQKGLQLIKDTIAGLRISGVDPIGEKADQIKRSRESITLAARGEMDGNIDVGAFQRGLVQQAMATGELSERQMYVAQRLLLGYKFNADEVLAIFKTVEADAQSQVDAQEGIVTARQAEIDAMIASIAHAEHLLLIDRDRHVEILAGLNGAIELENSRWAAEKEHIADIRAAARAAHEEQMGDIAARWALELARLDMSEEEIQGIVDEAIRTAERVSEEAMRLYQGLMSGVRDLFASEPPIMLPPVELPPSPPGGPILPPGVDPSGFGFLSSSGGALEIGAGGATFQTATIQTINLQSVIITGTEVNVRINGKEIAAEIVDEIAGDAVLTDKIGQAIGRRAARVPAGP